MSFFNDPYFRNKPALASLEKIQNPTPEHVRSCLLEMARDIIAMKRQEPTPIGDARQQLSDAAAKDE